MTGAESAMVETLTAEVQVLMVLEVRRMRDLPLIVLAGLR